MLITKEMTKGTSEEAKVLRKIVNDLKADIKKLKDLDEDFNYFGDKYERLPDDYLDGTETEGYVSTVDVPESMVWGGKAILEFHFRMSFLSKVYFVA